MRTLIVYESLFGTNRTIAEAIATGMGDAAMVTLVDAADAPATIGEQVDLLVVGGPNHKAGLPRPATRAEAVAELGAAGTPAERGLREWLEEVRLSRTGAARCGVGHPHGQPQDPGHLRSQRPHDRQATSQGRRPSGHRCRALLLRRRQGRPPRW
jgi:hypothetical protein